MKKIIKSQKGIAAIAIVLIIVLSAAAGGTTFLGVRSLITGDPFLQPFEDVGLIELEENKEEKSKDDKISKNDEEKVDETISDEENDNTEDIIIEGQDTSLLIDDINDDGVECYTITVDLKEVADGMISKLEDMISTYITIQEEIGTNTDGEINTLEDAITEFLDIASEIFTDCEIILDCYASGNDIKQLLITFEYEQLAKNIYNKISDIERLMQQIDPTADIRFEYDSYESFLADFEVALEESFSTESLRNSLSEELSEENSEIINTAESLLEDKKIQISLNLSSIKIDTFIMNYRDELEELGIDPDNLIESIVELWNENVDKEEYATLINELYTMIFDTYNMFSL